MRKPLRLSDTDQAQAIGLSALAFLAEDLARLTRFLELTGLAPAQLRAQAQSPALLAAVLDHILADESMLLVFTSSHALEPESLAPARDMLQRAG